MTDSGPTKASGSRAVESARPLRTFGRTGGRPLSPRRAELVDTLLPKLAIPESDELDLHTLFADEPERLWLEIGFGGGEHLAGQAAANPDVHLIGAEPFVEGVAKLLAQIEDNALANIRIHPGDVREIMQRLPDGCLERVFILFPDPWPKTRHRKRRLVQADFLNDLARLLKPGGRVRFATDIADYANNALAAFLADGRYAWGAEQAADWSVPPGDHIATRYERKRLGDCPPVYLDFTFKAGR